MMVLNWSIRMVRLSLQVQSEADECIDESNETLHRLARLHEAPYHSNLGLDEEGLSNLLQVQLNTVFHHKVAISIYRLGLAPLYDLFLEESSELRHTAS